MFSTKQNENLTKKEKVDLLLEKHTGLFEKLGISNPLYIPKMVFGSPSVFYIFPGELKHEKDVYIEKISKNYEPEDPERNLYRWSYNPNYKEDYESKTIGPSNFTGDVCYIIPFIGLTKMEIVSEADEFNIPDPTEDLPISELTIRDLTAILTGKAVSLKPWLNKIIKT
jgi:hypothetical protein